LLARALNPEGSFALAVIAGGASPRRFYRARFDPPLENPARTATAIAMLVPPETPDVAFASERGRPWPFLEVRDLLARAGVRVPNVFLARPQEGFLVVEDLGTTLAEHLAAHPGERVTLYRRAVLDLARAQAALTPLPEDSVVRLRQFDEVLYRTELEHFWEWGVRARTPHGEREAFERAAAYLVSTLAALPRGFTHRDYQSRNLLVLPGGELGWIDFQDALLGPRAYDLVALLCDSYQPFERAFVEARLDEYAAASGFSDDERRALGREFDLLTLERKLKDAGRFVFIERVRGDASFLPFVRPTLDIVLDALRRLEDVPELAGMTELVHAARSAA
jgi:aminoglycoside/choline kinase family phosphotransferase